MQRTEYERPLRQFYCNKKEVGMQVHFSDASINPLRATMQDVKQKKMENQSDINKSPPACRKDFQIF